MREREYQTRGRGFSIPSYSHSFYQSSEAVQQLSKHITHKNCLCIFDTEKERKKRALRVKKNIFRTLLSIDMNMGMIICSDCNSIPKLHKNI